MRLGKMREAGPARHRRRDRDDLLVGFREFRERFTDNFRIGRRWRWRGLAGLQFVFAESVKLVGLLDGRFIPFAFLCENVQQNRFFLCFQKLKCPDQ